METYSEQFPAEGRPDPIRRAEDRIFDANEDSDQPGIAKPEGQPDPGSPQPDFVNRTQGGGRFLLQVKGVH